MAHNLTRRENGMVEFAFTGPRSAIWHGLGNNLEDNASLEEWKKAAGMDWDVFESAVEYHVAGKKDALIVPDKKVLFRSDTSEALSVVGDKFNIVQPEQVIEFFRDLVANNGMRLSTAGTLFGGRRFWALADTGKADEVTSGDAVQGHLLLVTACDGSLATTAKFVSTRVVCNNTLTVALGENAKQLVKVSHRSQFVAEDVHIDLKLVDEGWANMMKNLRKMANKKMTAKQTEAFYKERLFDPKKKEEEQGWGVKKELERLMALAMGGSGSEMSKGTAWGTLCGATELYTHGTGKRDASNQFWDSYNGRLEGLKVDTYNKLLATV